MMRYRGAVSPLRDRKSGFLGDLRAGLPNRLGTGLQHKAGRNYHPFNGFQ